MDKRREPRFSAEQPVTVTILAEREIRTSGTIRNVSGRGVGLDLPVPVPSGAALKLEIEDAMVLAEAVFCRKEESRYFVGAAMEQVLSGLAELGRILERFQDGPSRRETVDAVDH